MVKMRYLFVMFVIGLLVGASGTYFVLSQTFTRDNVYYDSLPASATYTFDENNSGYYFATRTDGEEVGTATTDFGALFNEICASVGSKGAKFVFLDAEYLTSTTLVWKHGLVVEGMGESTIIKQAENTNLTAVIEINLNSEDSFGRVAVRNLVIDGNRDQQSSGSGYGIRSDTYSSVKGDFIEFEDLYIKNTRGIGIETNGNYHRFCRVYVYRAGSHGFVIKDYHANLEYCISRNNNGNGYNLEGTGLHELVSCRAIGNAGHGINIEKGSTSPNEISIVGGQILSNDGHGIYLLGTSRNRIISVSFKANSYTTSNRSDNIHFESTTSPSTHCTYNLVEGCTFYSKGKVRYHIREVDSNQDYNLFLGNILYDSGEAGNISKQGAKSVKDNNIGDT